MPKEVCVSVGGCVHVCGWCVCARVCVGVCVCVSTLTHRRSPYLFQGELIFSGYFLLTHKQPVASLGCK